MDMKLECATVPQSVMFIQEVCKVIRVMSKMTSVGARGEEGSVYCAGYVGIHIPQECASTVYVFEDIPAWDVYVLVCVCVLSSGQENALEQKVLTLALVQRSRPEFELEMEKTTSPADIISSTAEEPRKSPEQ